MMHDFVKSALNHPVITLARAPTAVKRQSLSGYLLAELTDLTKSAG